MHLKFSFRHKEFKEPMRHTRQTYQAIGLVLKQETKNKNKK